MNTEIHCAFCSALVEVESEDFPKGYFPCPSCNHTLLLPRDQVGPGTVIGRFEIERYLATSFTGRVYLARQMSMNRPVALKVLAPILAEQRSFIRGFIKQVVQAGLLRHPHIVSIYDAGESDEGIIYVAMRYVEGHSLAYRLEQDGPLPETTALALIRPLVMALSYAWGEQKILHQDLKPSSILVDESGQPQLVGLGASYVPRRGLFENHPDLVIGSPHYMSPERVRGDEPVDVRTDIYSLGATLYELVTGELPFPGHNLERVRKLVLEQVVISPRERNPVVSGGCSRFIEKSMAKHPDHRYDSWEHFLSDLDRVIAGKPPRARIQESGQTKPAAAHVQTAAGALARASAEAPSITRKSGPPPVVDPPPQPGVLKKPHKAAIVHIKSHNLPHPDLSGKPERN